MTLAIIVLAVGCLAYANGASATLDRLYVLSAGFVSFARGLNDTPKIAALLLLAPSLGGFGSTALVGAALGAVCYTILRYV